MSYIKHRSEESLEDYLETILLLKQKNGQVRSIDIAHELNYTKASISVAMKNLREKDLITMDQNGYISFTEEGSKKAHDVLDRHTILTNWLISIGVDPIIAKEDACKVEHDLSEESFQAIKHSIK